MYCTLFLFKLICLATNVDMYSYNKCKEVVSILQACNTYEMFIPLGASRCNILWIDLDPHVPVVCDGGVISELPLGAR